MFPRLWPDARSTNPKTSGLRRQRFRGLGRMGQLLRDKALNEKTVEQVQLVRFSRITFRRMKSDS